MLYYHPKAYLFAFIAIFVMSCSAWADDEIKIKDVYSLGMESANSTDKNISEQEYQEDRNTIGIDDTIVLKIENLKSFKTTSCNKPCPPKNISLYFDGKKVGERDINDGLLGKDDDTVEFLLTYGSHRPDQKDLNERIKHNWAALLGSPPFFDSEFWKKPVETSIVIDNGPSGKYKGIFLRRMDEVKFWIFLSGVVFLFFLPAFVPKFHEVIRNALSDIGNMPNTGGFKSWSLARCQMAFWFVIVAISFLSIWVVTGASDTITSTVLTLIGIGAGSAVGSALIDTSRNDQVKLDNLNKRKTELDATKTDLDGKIKALKVKIDDKTTTAEEIATKSKEIAVEKERLKATEYLLNYVQNKIDNKTNGFWNDIFNDNESADFHRIQMFVWTLILGVIFIYSVWETLAMPEFSTTLLALQGISAGTYLGFKLPDNKS